MDGDAVKWNAMANVMLSIGRHARLSRDLKRARTEGNVALSLNLCRAHIASESAVSEAVEVCGRLAGDELTLRMVMAMPKVR